MFLDNEFWTPMSKVPLVEGQNTLLFDGLDGDADHTYRILLNNLVGGTFASQVTVNCNGDVGTNQYEYLEVTVAGAISIAEVSPTVGRFISSSGMSQGEAAIIEIIINGRSGQGYHLIRSTCFTNGSGAGDMHPRSGAWLSSDNLTSIQLGTIIPGLAGVWADGALAELYKLTP